MDFLGARVEPSFPELHGPVAANKEPVQTRPVRAQDHRGSLWSRRLILPYFLSPEKLIP